MNTYSIELRHVKDIISKAWREYAAVTRPLDQRKYGQSYLFSRKALSRRSRASCTESLGDLIRGVTP